MELPKSAPNSRVRDKARCIRRLSVGAKISNKKGKKERFISLTSMIGRQKTISICPSSDASPVNLLKRLASAITCMSLFLICVISWPIIPAISSAEKVLRKPSVMQIAESFLVPAAKALMTRLGK